MFKEFDVYSGLLDPASYHEPIDIAGYNSGELLEFLESMILIRTVEIKLANERRLNTIGGPVHLGVGQEAVAVGISSSLNNTDKVFGAHRSHSHILALGSSPRKLFAEVLGRDYGLSRGMGGSMHLWDAPKGFYGSVPIVAGTVSLAVGAAIASSISATNDVAVAYFGDGACEEGVVHESLNLAKVQNAPVIFVVENNLFASHMHWSKRQPFPFVSRFAKANGVQYEIVDGNNVLDLQKVSSKFIASARSGGGPAFIEAITYRWYGHVDWRDDIDVGVARSETDVENWKARDPVHRLFASMNSLGYISQDDYTNLSLRIKKQVDEEWELATSDPYPSKESILTRVFK